MGWFLRPSNSKTKRKSKSKPRGRSKSARGRKADAEPSRVGAVFVRLFAWSLFLAVISAGWVYGEQALVQHLRQSRATMPQVELADQPMWMPPELIDQIRATVAMTVDPDPFDQLSLQDAKVTLEVNPWVHDVRSVERRPGGVIEVHASYRRPVALLERRDGYHAIDQFGVRLPWVYPREAVKHLDVAIIRGVQQSPPHPGEKWPGEDVHAGLKLAMLVEAQPWAHQVTAVDVTNHNGRLDNRQPFLLIHSERGIVRWGRPPGESRFYEPDAAAKLAHIDRVLQRFETIDANGRIVDVFTDKVMIRNLQGVQTADDRSLSYTATR